MLEQRMQSTNFTIEFCFQFMCSEFQPYTLKCHSLTASLLSFLPDSLPCSLPFLPLYVCIYHLLITFNYFAFLPYSPGGQSRNQPFLFLHIFSHVSLLWRFFRVASTALSLFLPRGDPPHVGIVSFFHPCPTFGEECLLESEEGRNLRPPQPSRPSDQTYIAVQSMR